MSSKEAGPASGPGRRWRIRLVGCVALVALGATGCAGVLDPVVGVGGEDRPLPPASFQQAVGYANQAKDEYFAAMSNQARLSTWVGGGLIPLAAVASGLALFGKTTSAIYVGLTGAGVWSTSLWFRNQPAQLAYLAGHEAVNCAVTAVVPFGSVDTKFTSALERIDTRVGDVRTAADALRAVLPNDPLLADAERLVANAIVARDNGRPVAALAATLPDQLVTTVDRIQAEVGRAVVTSQPDIASLGTLIGGFGSAYGQFGQVPSSGVQLPAKPPKGDGTPGLAPEALERGEAERIALVEALALLQADRAIVAAGVNAVSGQAPVDALKRCGVADDQIASALSVQPGDPYDLPAKAAGQKGFIVTGGKGPYAATVAGGAAGISVTPVEAFGPAFLIKTEATAPEGTHSILVRDLAGRQRFVELRIGAAGGGSAQSSQGGGGGGQASVRCEETAANPVASCAERTIIERLQRALCLPRVDGRWGAESQTFFEDHQRRVLKVASPAVRMTPELRDRLLALTPAEIDAACGPRALIDGLRELQRGLSGVGAVAVHGATYWFADDRLRVDVAAGKLRVPFVCRSGDPTVAPTADDLRSALLTAAGVTPAGLGPSSLVPVNSNDTEITPDQIAACG